MSRFANIRALAIAGKTAEYTLFELDEDPKPVLILRPASSENPQYFNELLREYGGRQGAQRMRQGATPEMLEKQRDTNRRLFPIHVVVGWRDLKDQDGNEVAFSQGAAAELFQALPGYILDAIRQFAEDPNSFLEAGATRVDAEAVGGN